MFNWFLLNEGIPQEKKSSIFVLKVFFLMTLILDIFDEAIALVIEAKTLCEQKNNDRFKKIEEIFLKELSNQIELVTALKISYLKVKMIINN